MEKVWDRCDGTPLRQASEVDTIWGSTQEISHNGKTVLFAQAHKWETALQDYVIVPGYKIGEYYQLNGKTAVKVEPVATADHEAIRRKIESITQAPITFW